MTDKCREAFEDELTATVAVNSKGEAFILEYSGSDLGLFDNGLCSEDNALIVPDLPVGIYHCSDFRTTNISRDWESGIIDDWDLECDWKPFNPTPQPPADIEERARELAEELNQWLEPAVIHGMKLDDCVQIAESGTHCIALALTQAEARGRTEERERAAGIWQPIETAPKEAKDIILFNGWVSIGFFAPYLSQFVPYEHTEDNNILFTKPPTHWMPLPNPPAIRGAKEVGE